MPKKGSAEVEAQRKRIAEGQQLEAGWCYDADREVEIFKCGELEQSVADGKLSVSFNGALVQNLETGEVEKRKARPATFASMSVPTGPTTGADTVTTGAGGGGGGGGGRT